MSTEMSMAMRASSTPEQGTEQGLTPVSTPLSATVSTTQQPAASTQLGRAKQVIRAVLVWNFQAGTMPDSLFYECCRAVTEPPCTAGDSCDGCAWLERLVRP